MIMIHKDIDPYVGFLIGKVYDDDFKLSHIKFYNDLYIVFKKYPFVQKGIYNGRLKHSVKPNGKTLRMHNNYFWIRLLNDFMIGKDEITFHEDQSQHMKDSLFQLAELFGYYCVNTDFTQKELMIRTIHNMSKTIDVQEVEYYIDTLPDDKIVYFENGFLYRCSNRRNATEEERKKYIETSKRNLQNYIHKYLDHLYSARHRGAFHPSNIFDLDKSYTMEELKKRHINWEKNDDDDFDSWIPTGEINYKGEALYKYNQLIRFRRCFMKNIGGRLKLIKINAIDVKSKEILIGSYIDFIQNFHREKIQERKKRKEIIRLIKQNVIF